MRAASAIVVAVTLAGGLAACESGPLSKQTRGAAVGAAVGGVVGSEVGRRQK